MTIIFRLPPEADTDRRTYEVERAGVVVVNGKRVETSDLTHAVLGRWTPLNKEKRRTPALAKRSVLSVHSRKELAEKALDRRKKQTKPADFPDYEDLIVVEMVRAPDLEAVAAVAKRIQTEAHKAFDEVKSGDPMKAVFFVESLAALSHNFREIVRQKYGASCCDQAGHHRTQTSDGHCVDCGMTEAAIDQEAAPIAKARKELSALLQELREALAKP